MKETKTKLSGVLMLLLTALIWGVAFVAQDVGIDKIGAFTFSGIRTLMGAIVLLPFIIIRDKSSAKKMTQNQLAERKLQDKKTMKNSILLGAVFCLATNLQQFAFYYSEPGKIAFITAMYMFFVPLLGLFIKKRVPLVTWICVVIGFIGLYFLCIDPENISAINFGDFLTFLCAIVFAVHILLIEKFSADSDSLKLSAAQFAVGGTIASVLMFIFESPSLSDISEAIIPLLYAGVCSCGIAYTLQIIGQKKTEATTASLIMCTESVFGAVAPAIILGSVMTGREILGCVIMFAAIVLSQFSDKITEKLRSK